MPMQVGADESAAGMTRSCARVERQLAHFVGPMAKVMMRKAVANTTDLTELYALLSENIADEADKKRFNDGMQKVLTDQTGTGTVTVAAGQINLAAATAPATGDAVANQVQGGSAGAEFRRPDDDAARGLSRADRQGRGQSRGAKSRQPGGVRATSSPVISARRSAARSCAKSVSISPKAIPNRADSRRQRAVLRARISVLPAATCVR